MRVLYICSDSTIKYEAVVNRTELSMQPTIKLNQAVGFNLWALKAVLNGRRRGTNRFWR
jgi:hypothetical protein